MSNHHSTTIQANGVHGASPALAAQAFHFDWQLERGSSVGIALHAATRRLKGAGVDSPKLDSEILLGHVLGWTRAQLYTHMERPLTDLEREQFQQLVERRLRYEPVAYLVRQKSFYGLDLYVDPRVLIPRPETELLVDLVLDVVVAADQAAFGAIGVNGHGRASAAPALIVADVGTGSGAVSLAVAANTRAANLVAVDISPDALAVARANAARLRLDDRIRFIQGDLLEPLDQPVDVVVANLPYVAPDEWDELAPDIVHHEPSLALAGGAEGLDVIRRLLAQAPGRLRPGGVLLLEIGARQGTAVAALARAQFPHALVEVVADYAYNDRIVRIHT